MQCPQCSSSNIKRAGGNFATKAGEKSRHVCKECGTKWAELVTPAQVFSEEDTSASTKKTSSKKYVITSCQSNTESNIDFLVALFAYCEEHSAELIVIPVPYKTQSIGDQSDEHRYDEALHDYLLHENIYIHDNLKVLGQLKIVATAVSPLSGLDAVCKGDSVIVGHNQLQMKTLPVLKGDFPVIMTTTGTVSHPNYQISKQGYKATFNHNYAAILVEIDDENYFHMRQLEFDGIGFYDLNKYYKADGSITESDYCEALVTGDEHVMFIDPNVTHATYYDNDSITALLKPRYIVRHDVLDSYSVSHHHENNLFIKYAKYVEGANNVERELQETVDFVEFTTPDYSKSVIIASNHNDHLTRWLMDCNPKEEPWNALFYHKMMVSMLNETTMGRGGASYPNPFTIYYKERHPRTQTIFLGRNESFIIAGIELSQHGDRGVNGSRGTRNQFSNIPTKTVIGHSHSPGITQGCYQVGTSAVMSLEYNSGPSSWLQTHCIVYKNGKRCLINIINGKWKA